LTVGDSERLKLRGADEDLRVVLGRGEVGEGLGHAVEADFPGEER
jgi:hypothetical protein